MFTRSLLLLTLLVSVELSAQELQSRVSIIANKVSSQVDRKIFQTLQGGLTNFINTRKWTSDAFATAERIQCSFLISIDQDLGNNVFKGKLTVQAARPVYNTTYDSPLINFQDDNVVFKYVEFQPIEFNENRVQGNDPLVANLTAVIAFYINIILGLDYDSYSLRGGEVYFQRAWNIVNNAPGGRDIAGWKSFDGLRNRYWLAENMNNNRFALVHDAIYAYYRTGMLNALNYLNTVNTDNLNSMIVPFLFQGKANELVKVFGKGTSEQRNKARELLTKMDITNIALYKTL